jgi:uncharacterized damage-inducible protein DinB
MRNSPILDTLLDNIETGYARKAWHGPNLKGSIRGLSLEEVCWRPGPDRHNIWEIVVHTAYWKYAVRRRILGEKRGSFPHKGSNWFDRPGTQTHERWRDDVRLLDDMHQSMRDAIAGLNPGDLYKIPRGNTMNILSIVMGIAAHDVYHAGQIQLIKRLCPKR